MRLKWGIKAYALLERLNILILSLARLAGSMRLKLKDFGPIAEADLLIRPFTVLTGANAVGKSYVAYALWCLLSVEPDWWKLREIIESRLDGALESPSEAAPAFKEALLEVFLNLSAVFRERLEELLRDAFQVDALGEIVRQGSAEGRVEVCSDDNSACLTFVLSDGGLEIEGCRELAKVLSAGLLVDVSAVKEGLLVELRFGGELLNRFKVSTKEDAAVRIAATIPSLMVRALDGFYMYADCVVLPDGRAGLLRTVQALSYVLLSTREQALVNAVDSSFIRRLQALPPRVASEEIASLAAFFEERMGAAFSVGREPPRFRVAVRGVELPLERAPSGLREVAPLIYVLRHALRPGSFLVVEEPEAHLHPDAQALVTRVLAGLAKRGVTVVATTHSLHVVDELSNLLRLGSLSPEEKSELGYEEWEGLRPGEICVYHIEADGRVMEVEVSEEGLDETGLERVASDLAGAYAAVERYFRSRGP